MRIWELGLGTAIGAMILANPVHAANWVSVWQTNFNTNQVFQTMGPFDATASYTAGGAQIVNAQSLPGFGNRYLRNATNGTTRFNFTQLDGHKALKLQFDIALLDSWDNPNSSWGPDYLYVTIGSTTYQWAPAWPGTLVGNGHYAQNGAYKDSVFRHEFIVPHVSDSFAFAIRAGGSGFQGGNDESWGIDNIRLYADAVPEPKSWAMLIAGFGLVGATVRRRRETSETC
jgi:hypothetical protein